MSLFFRNLTGYSPNIVGSKESLALFNQQLAQSLYLAQQRDDICGPVTQFVQTIRALNAAGIPLGVACNMYLSGARGQAGLMDTLEKNGYTVVVPDTDDRSEVALWDAYGGTDIAACKNNVVLLVDAKSDSFNRSPWDYRDYHYRIAKTNDLRKPLWSRIVKSALEHINVALTPDIAMAHAEITLHNDAMDDLGQISGEVGANLISSIESRLGINS